ncbi:uncharacterized protein LOC115806456 [Chanos chanos]|uniref:Uncharacterized protein LOC115806456 n=1 Tax=Chanos chanos TaxID=29144 RepID=A0A6J2UV69_CHACN|nr:uncharacterized protein LOC115806456 [Chanos chanos]
MLAEQERLSRCQFDKLGKLAGQETEHEPREGERPQEKEAEGDEQSSVDSPASTNMVRAECEWEVPMCVPLPIEVLSPEQAFPLLDTTLADLGIEESAVKERIVWVDTKRTQVKGGKSGKLREKEVTVLEVRVKAQHPGDPVTQEVLFSTESHTDRSYCRSGVDIIPWKHREPVEEELPSVEMVMAVETWSKPSKWQKTEETVEVNSAE